MTKKNLFEPKNILIIIATIMIIGVLLLSYINTPVNKSTISDFTGLSSTIKNIKVQYDNGTILYKNLPDSIDCSSNYSVFFDVSDYGDLNDKAFDLFVLFSNIQCVADGEVFYEFKSNNNKWIKSGGYSNHIIDIPKDLKKKVIEIKYFPNSKLIKKHIFVPINIGRKSNILIYHLITDDFRIIFFTSLSWAIFLVIAFLFLLGYAKNHYFMDLLRLGLISLIFALYFSVQIWSVRYVLKEFGQVLYFMEFTIITFLPTQIIAILKGKLDPRFDKYFTGTIILCYLNAFVQLMLVLVFGRELKEYLVITHVIFLLSVFIITIASIVSNGKIYESKWPIVKSISLLSLNTVVSIIIYTFYKPVIYMELILSGVLFFIFAKIYYTVNDYINLSNNEAQARLYKELALIDPVTKFGNRNSYVIKIKEIQEKKDALWIVSMDLNNLKEVNDNYGHVMGDEMIMVFSRAINKAIKDLDKAFAYRVGGDEFLIFVYEKEDFNIIQVINKMKETIKLSAEPFSNFYTMFAYGVYYHNPKKRDKIDDSIYKADQKMYLIKSLYKKSSYRKVSRD